MPANECIPLKESGVTVSAKCTAAVTGCRFVQIEGDRTGGGLGAAGIGGLSSDTMNAYQVKHAAAKAQAFGVSRYDGAKDELIPVFTKGVGLILPVKSAEALTAGWEVESNASGEAIKLAAGIALGLVLSKSEAGGKLVEILLY